jgi:nucleotide-binding universal stress UspA family protein
MKKLIAAIDFSNATDGIITQASSLAAELDACLWVLHVASDESQAIAFDTTLYSDFSPDFLSIPGDVQQVRDLTAEELRQEHAELLSVSSRLRENKIDAHAVLLKGAAAENIVEKAIELQADLIILGSHGHGMLHKALLGSVSEFVIRHAPCNVMIVPTAGK